MVHDPLAQFLQTQKIPHALLVIDGVRATHRFARGLVGASGEYHPDIHLFYPDGKTEMHSIESLRRWMDQVNLSPFQAAYKVFLIHEAERMLPSSSHALLKTLEEPPPRTVMILMTRHRDKILPTILSRCQTLIYQESVETFAPKKAVYACLQGDLSGLDEIEQELEKGQEQIEALLELIMRIGRDHLVLKAKLPDHYLFFEESKQIALPSLSLSRLEERVREARLGFERSIKKRSVLHYLFKA